MNKKQIAIFAKSAKNNNYCVAGFDLDTKNWLRPISNNPNIEDAVPFEDATYLNFSDTHEVKIFDVVEIEAENENVDNLIQPESFYYTESTHWKKIGETTLQNILKWRGYDDRENIFLMTTEPFHLKKSKTKFNANHFCFCLLKILLSEWRRQSAKKFMRISTTNLKDIRVSASVT